MIHRRRILIDTDPGIDDAMALFYALASPEFDVVAVTTIFGNTDVELATTNALRLLDIAGQDEYQLVAGAEAITGINWTRQIGIELRRIASLPEQVHAKHNQTAVTLDRI